MESFGLLHAHEVLLSIIEGTDAQCKQAIFGLKTKLTEMHFGEEFIEQGGVEALLHVAEEGSRPALQKEALEVQPPLLLAAAPISPCLCRPRTKRTSPVANSRCSLWP